MINSRRWDPHCFPNVNNPPACTVTRGRLHTVGYCDCHDYMLFTGNREITVNLLNMCSWHTDRVWWCDVSWLVVMDSSSRLKLRIRGGSYNSDCELKFSVHCRNFCSLCFSDFSIHCSDYAIMMLLALTIFQGIVLEVEGRGVGSWWSLRHRRSMTLLFLFSLPGATL